jgi:hypothetical protein
MRNWVHANLLPKDRETSLNNGLSHKRTIIYSGLGNYFHDLLGHNDFIQGWLVKRSLCPQKTDPVEIAVHIRLGDFMRNDHDKDSPNVRQPIAWYREAIDLAKSISKNDRQKVTIFTDSYCTEVAELEHQFNAKIDHSNNALQAIIRMSQAKILVGSRSTFSLWGAFLGAEKSIWPAHFPIGAYKTPSMDRDVFL